MGEKEELKKMVDQDISYCKEAWEEYSHDREVMETIFNKILFQYLDKIQGLAENLQVVSSYEDKTEMADTYRNNVSFLISRLEAFRENGYQNEGLAEYYLNREKEVLDFDQCLEMTFNQARRDIENMKQINKNEKNEIIDKIDAIEEIMVQKITRREKWERLRPYVFWLSGKELEVAFEILPLILKIE